MAITTEAFTPQRIISVNMDYDPDQADEQHENGVGGVLDMDIMHDFGEGVGVDMRDFPSHDGIEGEVEVGKEEIGTFAYGTPLHPLTVR